MNSFLEIFQFASPIITTIAAAVAVYYNLALKSIILEMKVEILTSVKRDYLSMDYAKSIQLQFDLLAERQKDIRSAVEIVASNCRIIQESKLHLKERFHE
jgi:hypothetical protein